MSEDESVYFLEKQFITFPEFECDEGWILDFGGGGEGIVGQVKGYQVIAIDRRMSELKEALERNCKALMIEMDGTNLKFLDNTFSTATAFFSLMYVRNPQDMKKIFMEIYRVLKPGGKFLIWDANLSLPSNSDKKVVAMYLDITLPSGKVVETGYGTKKSYQKLEEFEDLGKKVGFEVITSEDSEVQFHLGLKKP